MVNKYFYRSRISESKFRQIIKLYSQDLQAVQISNLTRVSRVTINNVLQGVRQRIAKFCEAESPFMGEIEVDESYFGARRVKGKRGRGAYGKTIVFGVFKRNGKVYTEIVPDASSATLQAIIRGKVSIDSIIHSDQWRGYNGLVDLGYKKHFRVNHSKNEFVSGRSHINGIEGFWGFAKSRLAKFKGIHKSTIYLHLKESEFRYNYRKHNLYKLILNIVQNNPLNLS